jgi:DNA-directed RNA polymerase II subunit RPB1
MQHQSNMNSSQMPSKIIGIQFSMLSPEEIRKNSVVEVTSRDTYNNNKPVVGGLFDPRMGVLEPGMICPTDGLSYINTPGYFGHIELARPVFAIQHIKDIIKIARSVCFKCSKLLINKNQHKHILTKTAEERWNYVSNLTSKMIKRCGEHTEDGCGCRQPDKIKLEGMATLVAMWENIETNSDTDNKKVTMKLTPEIVLKIFKRISDDDVSFMGFSPKWSRPNWMIFEVLPVPPPAVRPSVKHDAQQRSEDDLTHIYSNIIKTNNILREKLANPDTHPNVTEGWFTILQHSVAMIVNNKIKGVAPMAQRSGRPLQCIMGRLNAKNGRIRGNLMGKRVDFSARSVITGDPNLSVKQLGVPLKIAMNITKPVTVNDRTREFLTKLVQNGPDKYPGAKILERKNGEHISLRYRDRESISLANGDVVHRHMMDGDAVLFNRQPSLHRMSMMCHIVKVMKIGDTFRMNVGDTKPYNADFDGDEMNMHMPQNVLAETELRQIAAIPYQVISPASNSPIIGIYQDSLLGSYRMTRPNINFTPREAMNLLMMFPDVNTDAIRAKGKTLSSFDVLSQIMPPLTMMYKTNKYKEGVDDFATSPNVFELRNGQMFRGQLDKSIIGSTTKGILHRVHNDFGNMACVNFNDNLQNIVTEYLKTSSYSVGISDLIANKETQTQILTIIAKQKAEVQELIEQVHLGVFENNTSRTNNTEFETTVNNILNKATDEAGQIGRDSLDATNKFLIIINSGSKGTPINISQMVSCLGQTNVDGKRIPYGFDGRTLPHYQKFDDSPGARGFIENSYISGLTAPELFFHAMGGRIGLIDTAVKTSQTGYIQRRLIKGLEDLKVEYDMTVRNNKGKIIQFKYGDDSFDTGRVENQIIPLVGMSVEDIYMHYDIIGTNDQTSELLSIYNNSTKSRIKKQKVAAQEKCRSYISTMLTNRDRLVEHVFKHKNENNISMPVSFQNIITNIQGQMGLNANSVVDITPLEAFELIEEYFDKMNQYVFSPLNQLFKIMYYFYLSPKDLLVNKRFHRKGLIVLLELIALKYKEALIHPGEMVGVIAGQSIGEPTTQLTLNTFHLAGVSSKSNVTRGVPRIEEILRLTRNPKHPSLTVYLKPNDESDQDKATAYATMMEHTKLIDITQNIQLCFEPYLESTTIDKDLLLMEQYHEFENLINDCISPEDIIEPNNNEKQLKSKWVVRLEFDSEIMLDKNITMDDVHFAVTNSQFGNDISCVYSDFNSDKLVFRMRVNNTILNKNKKKGVAETLDQSDDIYLLNLFQDALLNNIVLRGLNHIDNVIARKIQNSVKKVDEMPVIKKGYYDVSNDKHMSIKKDDGKYVKNDIWVLDTTGTNLMKALGLDYIDSTRTISNDIREVFHVLGIEASRQSINSEMNEVMEFSGVYINYHHLGLLCDRMTCNHNMVPIYRAGLLSDNVGPIAKATYEVHTEVLLNATRHGDFDHMRGVSANVMCGQHGNYGTGAFQVVLDMKEMEKQEAFDIHISDDAKDIEDAFGIVNDKNECSKSQITIQNNISNIKPSSESDICDDNYNMGF